jgi:putative transposase
MNLGRPLAPLQLQREQREQLQAMASSRSLPHGLVTRVRIILLSADGLSNKDIAARLRLNQVTVGLWRRRFVKQGLTGLHEELRSGRPRSIPDEKVATLIRRTLQTKPKDGTHWSCRSWRQKPASRNRPSTGSGAPSACSRTERVTSSFPTTRSASRRYVT